MTDCKIRMYVVTSTRSLCNVCNSFKVLYIYIQVIHLKVKISTKIKPSSYMITTKIQNKERTTRFKHQSNIVSSPHCNLACRHGHTMQCGYFRFVSYHQIFLLDSCLQNNDSNEYKV